MRITLLVLLAALSGLIWGSFGISAKAGGSALPTIGKDARLPIEGRMPALGDAEGWLNSMPLRVSDLRGKVVVVNFWTYTCINWLRTAPYLRAWADKYRDQGLIVVGVHSPEFGFEKDIANVERATRRLLLDYPVLIDSEHAVWRSFGNQYWPATYLVDAQGRIRYHQFGEGNYEKTEQVIQQLLREAGATNAEDGLVSVNGRGAEATADWSNLGSPENYLGYERTAGFASRKGGLSPGKLRSYAPPDRLKLNEWALSGNWTARKQNIALDEPAGRIVYQFHARDLHLVMGPTLRGTSVRFRVTIDGRPPGVAHGADIDAQGQGIVSEHRLHQLIRQTSPVSDRRFEIEFLDAGVEAFAFTFG